MSRAQSVAPQKGRSPFTIFAAASAAFRRWRAEKIEPYYCVIVLAHLSEKESAVSQQVGVRSSGTRFRVTGLVRLAVATAVALLIASCATPPPGAERGPGNTIAYDVLVESSPPGAHIEVNGNIIGDAPLHAKIFGDLNGKFQDLGVDYFVVRALPVATNQFVQTRLFGTGHEFTPKDRIPDRIQFDMSKPSPVPMPVWAVPPGYYYPYPYGPPYYYPPYYYGPWPYYYGPRYYYGPPRYYYGPHVHHH